jgi:hypothetical protein
MVQEVANVAANAVAIVNQARVATAEGRWRPGVVTNRPKVVVTARVAQGDNINNKVRKDISVTDIKA